MFGDSESEERSEQGFSFQAEPAVYLFICIPCNEPHPSFPGLNGSTAAFSSVGTVQVRQCIVQYMLHMNLPIHALCNNGHYKLILFLLNRQLILILVTLAECNIQ